MGFSNQERINLNSKVLAAGVIDANEVAQWYESRFLNEFTLDTRKVWTQFDELRSNPAASLAIAQANAAGPLAGIIIDRSAPASAIRLTPVTGTNSSTFVALTIFGDFSSDRLDNWIQPQGIPQSSGAPSNGYAIRLYDGDPNAGGIEILTSDGQTGTGENASVAWVWNYSLGVLFLSEDFRSSISSPNNLYVLGFQYIGETLADITGGGSADGYAPYQEILPVSFDGQTSFTLTEDPWNDLVLLFISGVKQAAGIDYTVSGTTLTYTAGIPISTTDTVEVVYFILNDGGDSTDPPLDDVLASGNLTGSIDIDFQNASRAINLLDPINSQDAATKAYVDGYAIGAVSSVFGRIGDVIAVAGDYDSDLVDNVSTVIGSTVSDALEYLKLLIVSGGGGTVTGPISSNLGSFAIWDSSDGYSITDSDITTDGYSITIPGDIIIDGYVDGRNVAIDGLKLDGIEPGAQVNTVDSVFGRTGVIVAVSGDYDSDFIDNASGVPGITVSEALDYLDGYIGSGAVSSVFGRTGAVVAEAGDYDSDQIINVSTVNGATVTDALDFLDGYTITPPLHADTHLAGQSDELDGYNVALNYIPQNYSVINDITGEHIAAIDAYLGTLLNKRTVLVQFALTDDVYNWSPFFFTWRGTGSDSNVGKRSGATGGIGITQNCSPFQVPFDATITKAVLTVSGVGVQNGSVTYPVSYETDLFDVGFSSISKLADVDFSISNSFTVGTYTVGTTNFKGSTILNIDVDEGDMLGLRFINGTGPSVAGQSRMAFVTFVMEER
jgi:hypothetical protein